jgi:hypothetical protein
MNLNDLIDAVRADMAAHGVVTDNHLIADGVLHRAKHVDDKSGSTNISYLIHTDGNLYRVKVKHCHYPSAGRSKPNAKNAKSNADNAREKQRKKPVLFGTNQSQYQAGKIMHI